MAYTLSRISLYPVKSLRGIELSETVVEARGLRFDRRWMLVDKAGRFLSQREHSSLVLVDVSFDPKSPETMTWQAPGMEPITFSCLPAENASVVSVQIWRSTCDALDVGESPARWMQAYLGAFCRLVYMPDSTRRTVNPQYTAGEGVVSFADGYPCLLAGQASLDQLNERLGQTLSMRRFRPNFVVEGSTPHEEDGWKEIAMGAVPMKGVKPCDRCVVITIDPETAEASQEPLATLASYRKRDGKVWFGQNLIPLEEGVVRLGDTLVVQATWKT